MSVDGFIFERNSKRYYSYDRDTNLYAISASEHLPDTNSNGVRCCQADDIRYSLMERGADIPASHVITMCDYLISGFSQAKDERENHRQYAAANVKKFVEAFPNGSFFIRMDNDDAYDLVKDMHGRTDSWTGEYSEWKPE